MSDLNPMLNKIGAKLQQTTEFIFNQYDLDSNGFLDKNEITQLLGELGVDNSPAMISRLLYTYDVDGSNSIQKDEFESFLQDI
jgi:Ca2+-binding EF-hand superfamily protein